MADRPPFISVLTPDEIEPEALRRARARAESGPDHEPQTMQPQLLVAPADLDQAIHEESPTMMGHEPETISAVAPIVQDGMPSPLGLDDSSSDVRTAISAGPLMPLPTADDDDEVATFAGEMSSEVIAARAAMVAEEAAATTRHSPHKPGPMRGKKMTLLGVAPHSDYQSPPSSSEMRAAPTEPQGAPPRPAAGAVPRPGSSPSTAPATRRGSSPGESAPMRAAPYTAASYTVDVADGSAPMPSTLRDAPRPGSSAPMPAAQPLLTPAGARRTPHDAPTIETERPADISIPIDATEPGDAATREMSVPEALVRNTLRIPGPPAGQRPPPASEPSFRAAAPPSAASLGLAPAVPGPAPLPPTIPPRAAAPAGVSRAWMVIALLATAVAFAAVAWIIIERLQRGADPTADPAASAAPAPVPAAPTTASAEPEPAPPASVSASAAAPSPAVPDISELPGLSAQADAGAKAASADAGGAVADGKPAATAPSASASASASAAAKPAAPKWVAPKWVAPKPKPKPKPAFKPVPKPPAWKPAKPPPTPKNPYG